MGDPAKSLQPDLVRLLAIHCLGKAVYKRPTWGDVQSPQDLDTHVTMIEVTRNISTLCQSHRLDSMMRDLQCEFQQSNESITQKLAWDPDSESLIVVDGNQNEGSKITSSHIKGEAYEILSAIIFKCKQETPLILKNYYSLKGDMPIVRDCRVTRVFLTEKDFIHTSLQWQDNNVEWNEYLDERVASYLKNRGAPEDIVENIVTALRRNIETDIGFDIFVELEEAERPENRHFLIAQCKYRSNEEAEVKMGEYVGKYYNLVHLFDKVHDILRQNATSNNEYVPTLFPFFWISTESDPDSMKYFTHLCTDGRIRFYGNVAMRDDDQVCNLICNIKDEINKWKEAFRLHEKKKLFQFKQRNAKDLHDYQRNAVNAVLKHFQNNTASKNASIIMATGSGKTLTSLACTRSLENVSFKSLSGEENIAASLHFSPMIRLVIQNAHVWLSEELALHQKSVEKSKDKSFKMIYYCICSLKKEKNAVAFPGCTSVRLIETDEVFSVFSQHSEEKNLHYCRFFTTYQAGKVLRNIFSKINLRIYHRHPNSTLFGVTVRDEAHTAVGRGSKSYSASLYIPTHIGLSFTASPKYTLTNLSCIFQDLHSKEDPRNQEVQTFCSIHQEKIFPQVDDTVVQKFLEDCQEEDIERVYNEQQWDPLDLLSDDSLFCEENSINDTETKYDWAYFQRHYESFGVVVFYIDDTKVAYTDRHGVDCFEVCLDDNGDPKYFGVAASSNVSLIKYDTKCFGVNQTLTTLYKTHGNSRGFHLHDMTGLGKSNKIGPVIYKLGYSECMEKKCLAKPRLIMLKRRYIPYNEYQKYNIEHPQYIDTIFGAKWTKEKGRLMKQADKVAWRLSIAGKIIESTAHGFRSMKLLFDCFFFEDRNKGIKSALVFCLKTEQSKECKLVFDAMLDKAVQTGHLNEHDREEFYTGVIYTSDNLAQDDDDIVMDYDAQQITLSKFCTAPRGVLFNVKLIGIGVDLPSVDAALVLNPGKSASDITQKIGRILRVDTANPDKVATVIIPSWDASDISASQACSDVSNTARDAAAESSNPPSTPVHGIVGSRAEAHAPPSTPEGYHISGLYTPVLAPFENRFFLQVRVLEAINDKNIKMISSFMQESYSINARKKTEECKNQTGNQIISDLTGDGRGNPFIPTFDESFSEFLLNAWDWTTVDILAEKRSAQNNVTEEQMRNFKASKAFMLLVFAACCHQHNDYGANFLDKMESYIWYKSGDPFCDNRLDIDAMERRQSELDWTIFDFKDHTEFKQAITNKNGKYMKIQTFRDKFDKITSSERDSIIENFLDSIEKDATSQGTPTHAKFLEILCECLKAKLQHYSCENHEDHSICQGFQFQSIDEFKKHFKDFIEWNGWMNSARKPPSTNRGTTSTCTKRRHEEHSFFADDDEVLSPESMDIDCDLRIFSTAATGSRKSRTTKNPRRAKSSPTTDSILDPTRNLEQTFENASPGRSGRSN